MQDAQFSDDFCRFLQTTIPAVDAAETLLLIADRPEHWWTLAELLGGLRPRVALTEAEGARYIEAFVSGGLLEIGEDRRFRFRAPEALIHHVRTLAQAYEERPVTLIRVIYALRDAKIRTFADAFNLRKK
ncbi:MAG: hypothetical protein ACM30H_06035 [Clostridia bacterium]